MDRNQINLQFTINRFFSLFFCLLVGMDAYQVIVNVDVCEF